MRPIVDIYSTFLQRAYDHVFQEVTLQNLPVTFLLDRGGLAGPDGPTHHGVFDLAYLRLFPNLVMMAPGDGEELQEMLAFALKLTCPATIRYPKASADPVSGVHQPVELGRAEVVRGGSDGAILCCGALLKECVAASDVLRRRGLEVTV